MTIQTRTSPGRTIATTTSVDQWGLRIADLLVLTSLALSQLHSVHWLWFTAFVGVNLLQASITGFCPLATILHKFGVRSGAAFCPSGVRR
jgi:hypothetical protein